MIPCPGNCEPSSTLQYYIPTGDKWSGIEVDVRSYRLIRKHEDPFDKPRGISMEKTRADLSQTATTDFVAYRTTRVRNAAVLSTGRN